MRSSSPHWVPASLASPRVVAEPAWVRVGLGQPVRPGDHAQRPGVATDRIEVEADLDQHHVPERRVGMPAGVTGIEMAAAAPVVPVVADQAGEQRRQARVVDEVTQPLAVVDERLDRRVVHAVVLRAPVVEVELELLGQPVDVVGHQARQDEIAERVEEPALFGTEVGGHR